MGKNKKSKQIATLNTDKNNKVSKKQDSISDELIVSELRAIAMAECFSGPLPPPEFLERYEKIVPGAADRIIRLAEDQQQHRIKTENTINPEAIKVNQRGQIFAFIISILLIASTVYFAFIISILLIASTVYFAYLGMQSLAIAMTVVLGSGIIATFISGKIEQKESG